MENNSKTLSTTAEEVKSSARAYIDKITKLHEKEIADLRALLEYERSAANEVIASITKECDKLRAEIECEERRFAVLQDQLAEVAKEKEELRAHLANVYKTLKPYFTSGNSIDVERAMIPKTVYDSLPQTAAHDAETLRCAEEQTRLAAIGGRASWVNYQNACIATCDAVRVREEIDK